MLLRLWQSFLTRWRSQPNSPDGLGFEANNLRLAFFRGWAIAYWLAAIASVWGTRPGSARRQRLVFVEVKTWRVGDKGDPSLAVDESKQEKLTRAALTYMKHRRLLEQPARFDVISIVWEGGEGKTYDSSLHQRL